MDNWWVTALDGNKSVVEEWILRDMDVTKAMAQAALAIENMSIVEVSPGRWVRDWSMRKAVISIDVGGGLVQDVNGLPDGFSYRVFDYDICSDCGGQDDECECADH